MDYRIEHDSMGEMKVPADRYWAAQTQRSHENFEIGVGIEIMPREITRAFGILKKAAALANHALKPEKMTEEKLSAIAKACDEVISGSLNDHFPLVVWQTGSGTQSNMNANEVIANRALQIMGHEAGEYQYCSPNDHVNCSQSTNDAYPTSVKIATVRSINKLEVALKELIASFAKKGEEFKDVIKMGRTQLQDAVPMTLGQEFTAYAATLSEEIDRLEQTKVLLYEQNMGATAIGTGINSDPDYPALCCKYLAEVTGLPMVVSPNMIEATNDTGAFVMNSSEMKRLAVKLSKICNDLRLMSSGPRCGLNEINLPPMQPGSSIMPGKVNPVIPEVVNQVAFRVIGNDLTVTFASEAAQLELNVMEPIIVHSMFENVDMLINAMNTLREKCVDGITANVEVCKRLVYNSIGLVTALNPYIGYENAAKTVKKAFKDNVSLKEACVALGFLTAEKFDEVFHPEQMV